MTSRVFWSIKASVWRGKIQIVSSEHLTGGRNWEAAPPEALSFNSISNLLADDDAGVRVWSAHIFNAQLRQLRDPVAGDNIGMALTEALHHAIEMELDREQQPAHHFVNFTITAHGFTHAYQTANFTRAEFLQRTARLDEMLATLAGKLNSNESFNPDRGFQVDVVFVSMPGRGSGQGRKYNPGRRCLDRENKKKRCIVTIKNRDALCCARAIVTMQAHCHKDQGVDELRQWDSLKKGYPVQQRQAQELHR